MTGNEACDPARLRQLLEERQVIAPTHARARARIEAENFRQLEGFAIEEQKDKSVSHQLDVQLTESAGRIRTCFDEPFTAGGGRYDIVIRYLGEKGFRFGFFVSGTERGSWRSTGAGWRDQTIHGVELRIGEEIRIDVEGLSSRIDFVQLNRLTRASD